MTVSSTGSRVPCACRAAVLRCCDAAMLPCCTVAYSKLYPTWYISALRCCVLGTFFYLSIFFFFIGRGRAVAAAGRLGGSMRPRTSRPASYIVLAYIVLYSYGLYRYGLYSYGHRSVGGSTRPRTSRPARSYQPSSVWYRAHCFFYACAHFFYAGQGF